MGVHSGDEAFGAICAMPWFRGANVIWLSQRHPVSRQSFHDRSGVIATLRSRKCELLFVAKLAGTERSKIRISCAASRTRATRESGRALKSAATANALNACGPLDRDLEDGLLGRVGRGVEAVFPAALHL